MESCEECGFSFDACALSDVGPRVRAAAETMAATLRAAPHRALVMPTADRWSAVLYGAHARDVLVVIRDRCVAGLVEDEPGFTPLYRDERVELGLYDDDTATEVALEIEAAAAMFIRLFACVAADALERPVRYGHPDPQRRTIGWMGQQAVHEMEHHLMDIELNLA